MESIEIKFKRLNEGFEDVELPHYATAGSAGMDIRAAVETEIIIPPNRVVMIPTNLSVEIPAGFEIQVRPRSGLAARHSLGILNSPGTIDSDYRGEIKVIMMNFGDEEFVVQRGTRIAQLIVSKIYRAEITETGELKNTSRGEGGFGHTGLH